MTTEIHKDLITDIARSVILEIDPNHTNFDFERPVEMDLFKAKMYGLTKEDIARLTESGKIVMIKTKHQEKLGLNDSEYEAYCDKVALKVRGEIPNTKKEGE